MKTFAIVARSAKTFVLWYLAKRDIKPEDALLFRVNADCGCGSMKISCSLVLRGEEELSTLYEGGVNRVIICLWRPFQRRVSSFANF